MFGCVINFARPQYSRDTEEKYWDRWLASFCDISLGKQELYDIADTNLTSTPLKKGFHSRKGSGYIVPKNYKPVKELGNLEIGIGEKSLKTNTSIWYNEYVVFHQDQMDLKYLVDFSIKTPGLRR